MHLHYRIQADNAFKFCTHGSPKKPGVYSLFSLSSVVLFPLQRSAAVTEVSGCVAPENPPRLQQQEKARAAGAGEADTRDRVFLIPLREERLETRSSHELFALWESHS